MVEIASYGPWAVVTDSSGIGEAFAGQLVARGRGGIVLTSALAAFQGLPNMAHDAAAKAYVLNLGEASARAFRRTRSWESSHHGAFLAPPTRL